MHHEHVLRDCRPIEAGRDYKRSFRARLGCSLDLFDGVARTLLTSANYERERSGNGFSRRLDYPKRFSLIEIDALACRAEHDIADHTRIGPLHEIADERFGVKALIGREWSSDWEQDAAEIDCHEPLRIRAIKSNARL